MAKDRIDQIIQLSQRVISWNDSTSVIELSLAPRNERFRQDIFHFIKLEYITSPNRQLCRIPRRPTRF
jgi:hypothetical protein